VSGKRAVKPVPPKELPDVPVRKQKPKAEAKAAAEVGPLPSSAAAPAVALAAAPAADPAAAAASAKQKGRSAGSSNYNGEDLDGTFYVITCYYCLKIASALLEILVAILPIGSASWALIAERFAEWAREHGRPQRDQATLRTKWMKLLKSKPTGAGGLSDRQKQMREIELKAHEAGGGDILGDDVDSSDDLEGNALSDIVDEADGIESKRT
jgi:hypothetical protein